MKFISLFAGIGGLSLGLERAGMECVAQVEIDDFCLKILTKHWPDIPKFKDVHNVGKHNLPTADLVCGGFPCQPHSLAGNRKASADDRDLWGEFARIIRECQPEWVLAENVPGILSSETGRFFGRVLGDLASSGYDTEWQSLPAAAFGAPHIRERVFIVAHHEGIGKGQLSIFARRSQQEGVDFDGVRCALSNSHNNRYTSEIQHFSGIKQSPSEFVGNGKIQSISDPMCNELEKSGNLPTQSRFTKSDWWSVEPAVGRVANGVPKRVDRLRGLGNAVVPQVAEFIGRCIIDSASASLEA